MYKFVAIEIDDEETTFHTYDMLCQRYNLKKSFLKKGLDELADSGILSYAECETPSFELYLAILNQDYAKITQLLEA